MYFIGADFEYNIDIEMVVKMSPEFDNVLMMETLVDFDLTA